MNGSDLRRLLAVIAIAATIAECGGPGAGPTGPSLRESPPPSTLGGPSANATPSAAATQAPPTATPVVLFPALSTNGLDARTAAALQGVLDALVAQGQSDAIAAVITPDGQWSGAAGVDGPGGRLALPNDMFNIASVGKTILAATIIRLARQGKLDLDAPLADYLGGLSVDANRATVRQALAMRSGIPETPSDKASEARADCGRVWTRTDLLSTIPAPVKAPGVAYAYSNPTYKLLSFAVETVTGQPLAQALRDEAIAPLGLDRILLQGPEVETLKPWALPLAGHTDGLPLENFGIGGTLPCISLSTFSLAGSAIASDAPTLARWAWNLFAGELIDEDGLAAMTTLDRVGHGLGIDQPEEFVAYHALGTTGHQAGYATWLVVVPARQIVVAIFINDTNGDAATGARRLIDVLR